MKSYDDAIMMCDAEKDFFKVGNEFISYCNDLTKRANKSNVEELKKNLSKKRMECIIEMKIMMNFYKEREKESRQMMDKAAESALQELSKMLK